METAVSGTNTAASLETTTHVDDHPNTTANEPVVSTIGTTPGIGATSAEPNHASTPTLPQQQQHGSPRPQSPKAPQSPKPLTTPKLVQSPGRQPAAATGVQPSSPKPHSQTPNLVHANSPKPPQSPKPATPIISSSPKPHSPRITVAHTPTLAVAPPAPHEPESTHVVMLPEHEHDHDHDHVLHHDVTITATAGPAALHEEQQHHHDEPSFDVHVDVVPITANEPEPQIPVQVQIQVPSLDPSQNQDQSLLGATTVVDVHDAIQIANDASLAVSALEAEIAAELGTSTIQIEAQPPIMGIKAEPKAEVQIQIRTEESHSRPQSPSRSQSQPRPKSRPQSQSQSHRPQSQPHTQSNLGLFDQSVEITKEHVETHIEIHGETTAAAAVEIVGLTELKDEIHLGDDKGPKVEAAVEGVDYNYGGLDDLDEDAFEPTKSAATTIINKTEKVDIELTNTVELKSENLNVELQIPTHSTPKHLDKSPSIPKLNGDKIHSTPKLTTDKSHSSPKLPQDGSHSTPKLHSGRTNQIQTDINLSVNTTTVTISTPTEDNLPPEPAVIPASEMGTTNFISTEPETQIVSTDPTVPAYTEGTCVTYNDPLNETNCANVNTTENLNVCGINQGENAPTGTAENQGTDNGQDADTLEQAIIPASDPDFEPVDDEPKQIPQQSKVQEKPKPKPKAKAAAPKSKTTASPPRNRTDQVRKESIPQITMPKHEPSRVVIRPDPIITPGRKLTDVIVEREITISKLKEEIKTLQRMQKIQEKAINELDKDVGGRQTEKIKSLTEENRCLRSKLQETAAKLLQSESVAKATHLNMISAKEKCTELTQLLAGKGNTKEKEEMESLKSKLADTEHKLDIMIRAKEQQDAMIKTLTSTNKKLKEKIDALTSPTNAPPAPARQTHPTSKNRQPHTKPAPHFATNKKNTKPADGMPYQFPQPEAPLHAEAQSEPKEKAHSSQPHEPQDLHGESTGSNQPQDTHAIDIPKESSQPDEKPGHSPKADPKNGSTQESNHNNNSPPDNIELELPKEPQQHSENPASSSTAPTTTTTATTNSTTPATTSTPPQPKKLVLSFPKVPNSKAKPPAVRGTS
ncbi:hypothetical protein Pelo_7909 [Pelomyxa schiedti]|nr:hypothetical protein Pelo_7909 [Pelomyxa schiedti]